MFLKISQNSHASTEPRFLIKTTERLQFYWKETPGQRISCEFLPISQEHLSLENYRTTDPGNDPGKSLVFLGKS